MTKTEYLGQLERKLRVLPYNDRRDALEYYEGYINDSDNEYEAISQLGSPNEVAAMILAHHVAEEPRSYSSSSGGIHIAPKYEPPKHGLRTLWVVLLAIFAVPIGLPLVIGLAGAAFGLFMGLLAVVFSIGVVAVTFVLTGAGLILTFPFVIAQDIAVAILSAGSGLVLIGFGILFMGLFVVLLRGGSRLISRFVGRSILKRRNVYAAA